MKKMIWAVVALLGLAVRADFNTALDCNELTFTTGGDAVWYEQTDVVEVGTFALRSGAITHDQTTWIETTVTNAGMLSFWWKASSESGYDQLEVSVDDEDEPRATIDGTGLGWVQKRVTIAEAGEHTVRWLYRKDGSVSAGEDCAWLDGVEFTPTPESMTVTFVTNGGDEIAPTNVSPGVTYGELPVPWKEGSYEFGGWYLDEALNEEARSYALVEFRDHTLYAKWMLPVSLLDTDTLSFTSDEWSVENGKGIDGHPAVTASVRSSNYGLQVGFPCENGTFSFKARSFGDARINWTVRQGCEHDWQFKYEYGGSNLSDDWRTCRVEVIGGELPVCGAGEEGCPTSSIEIRVNGKEGSVAALCDFEWTPAPETVMIHFDTRCDVELEPVVAAPGASVRDYSLPEPKHGDWVFLGWYELNDEGSFAEQVDAYSKVPLHDITLLANWKLPLSTLNTEGISLSAGSGWQTENERQWWMSAPDANLFVSGSFPDNGKDVGESYVPKSQKHVLTASVAGPSLASLEVDFFSLDNYNWLSFVRKGNATLTVSLDGKKQASWSKSHSGKIKVSVPTGTHAITIELSGVPGVEEYGTLVSPVVTLRGITRTSTAPQASFGEWLKTMRDGHAWVANDLPRFEKEYAAKIAKNPADYEARIMHAATILLRLGENKNVTAYAKKLGFTLNYLGMDVTGTVSKPSSWPAANAMVDTIVKEGVPVLVAALEDLEAIPSDWVGTVHISAADFPVDEDVYVDIGDVLYARASLEAIVGLAYFMHGYDLTADYSKVMAAVQYNETSVDRGPAVAYKLLVEQTKFMAKVRNQSSLSTSKSWVAAALTCALTADRAVVARGDDLMHFVEYDDIDAEDINRARNLTEKALAALSEAQTVDVQEEIVAGRETGFDFSLLPNDGVMQVYLGALFEGKITRDLLPKIEKGANGGPVPVMETIKDPTFAGLLPEFTARAWSTLLRGNGFDVLHQPVTIKLDANGGKVAQKSVDLYFDEDSEEYYYPELPVPTQAGFIFTGWATAKTGGAPVFEGDVYDAALFAGAKTPTLYAQWLKTYTITVKGEHVHAYWWWSDEQEETLPSEVLDGEYENELDSKGNMSVPGGAMVYVQTDSISKDKKGDYLAFQKWTVSSSKAVLGLDFRASENCTTLVMPSEKLTLQATYIDESTCGTLYGEMRYDTTLLGYDAETGEAVYLRPPAGSLEWSVDGGKNWYKATMIDGSYYYYGTDDARFEGEHVLLKAGKYTVTWRSTDPQWAVPTTKYTVFLPEDEDYGFRSYDVTFTPQIVVDVMAYDREKDIYVPVPAAGSVTLSPKDGVVQIGKSVTLTAKAAKGYAFQGYQFRKHWSDDELYFYETAATLKIGNWVESCCGMPTTSPFLINRTDLADKKVHVVAAFKALKDYSADDIVFGGLYGYGSDGEETEHYIEAAYDDNGNASVTIKAFVGCAIIDSGADLALSCDLNASPLTYKLNGKLPDGLKFDANKGVLSGAPKKAGTSAVTIVATDPANNSKGLTVRFEVNPLPTWLVGEYRGILEHVYYPCCGEESDEVPPRQQRGILELTVKSDGKVSAKAITRAGSRSVSGTLKWRDPEIYADEYDEGEFAEFRFSYWVERDESECDVGFYSNGTIDGNADLYYKAEDDWFGGSIAGMRQDVGLLGKDSPFLDKYYTFAFSAETKMDEETMKSGYGYLTIKTDKKGAAKVTGQLPDGEKVSMSALLLPFADEDESLKARLYVFASPSSYKKQDWFAMSLVIGEDGSVTSEDGAAWTPADVDPSRLQNYDGGYGYDKFLAQAFGEGALYSEAQTLEGYYWDASCEWNEAVRQQYSYKDNGETFYDDAYALELGGFFCVSVKGDKKGSISVADKSPAPWVEDGAWNCWEDKKGNAISNPSQLSISFAKATGIFSGKASVYFDEPKPTSASMPYFGVMIDDGEGGYVGFGSAVYTYKYSYSDYYGKVKTDTKRVTLPVSLEPAAAPDGE